MRKTQLVHVIFSFIYDTHRWNCGSNGDHIVSYWKEAKSSVKCYILTCLVPTLTVFHFEVYAEKVTLEFMLLQLGI